MPEGCFVPMEGQPPGNVRSPGHATKCAEGMKLPPPGFKVSEEHRAEYPDLRDEEIRAIGHVIFEKSEALWIKDTPQTMVRGFLHDMVTKGEPVSQAPLIRGGEHAEWLEAEIAKAYRRGHYVSGESNWGSPAFRVYSGARKPRMATDYRRVNQVTVRATFVMPDSVSVKRASAGKKWYSTGDGVSGFNQIENSLFAQRVLAVVSLSGKHLPRSLGPWGSVRRMDLRTSAGSVSELSVVSCSRRGSCSSTMYWWRRAEGSLSRKRFLRTSLPKRSTLSAVERL